MFCEKAGNFLEIICVERGKFYSGSPGGRPETLTHSCVLKMLKHTFKILRCKHWKIFKVCFTIFNIMHEGVNENYHVIF